MNTDWFGTANFSLYDAGSYSWVVDVPEDKIAESSHFVFRFNEHNAEGKFDITKPRMPSRAFILAQKAPSSSSSASTSTTAQNTVTSTKSQSTSATNGAEPSASGVAVKKTNTAAIAVGVLGGLVGIALVLGGVLFLLRQARKKREAASAEMGANGATHKGQEDVYAYYHTQELPAEQVSELPGDRHGESRELAGSTPRDWH